MSTPTLPAETLSVVIPAHNEEAYIGPCLDALVAQGDDIHEIIVVDNNSTDRTAAVVEAYADAHPKITLLPERAPGVAHARNAGFRAARGDVLGRVDADTRVTPGWARAVLNYLSADGAHVGGVTGLNQPYDSPVRGLKAWWFGRHLRQGAIGGGRLVTNLHGANMAIRKSAWHRVEPMVSTDAELHEDLDLALCLTAVDVKLAQLSDMNVDVSPRRALTPPSKFGEYIECGIRTFERHGVMTPERRKALRLHWWWHILVFAVYRPYDPAKGRYSVRRLFSPAPPRVLPVGTNTAPHVG
ncbi:glycosyltransferase family 2 protein [Rhodococcus sp. 14-2470-1a]|uniref:glycosyltransferase family 2 protein n=1 Tax=Rhodococcus sp. 14-2470-1a TaxID=2023150 RepID=UPI000B9B2F4E|nr:glycosyltransferase family 2 protein [Rhodococcus sp. 14-2470-1a]OZF55362.1 glycosyl transferase family 2 [Rhodococcus sp. 14-2470-1a]